MDDSDRNVSAARQERLRLAGPPACVEMLLLMTIEAVNYDEWCGMLMRGGLDEHKKFVKYLAEAKQLAKKNSSNPAENYLQATRTAFLSDRKSWQPSRIAVSDITAYKEDMSDAYCQLPVRTPSANLTGFWSRGKWRYVQTYFCSFGNSRSVYHYTRFMRTIVALARKILKVPWVAQLLSLWSYKFVLLLHVPRPPTKSTANGTSFKHELI